MSLALARTVADAVLYEGYLLYPYRATSSKNQSRWQFGVLGPPDAAAAGLGEEPDLAAQMVLVDPGSAVAASVAVRVRFLQLQTRSLERAVDPHLGSRSSGNVRGEGLDDFEPVAEMTVDGLRMFGWDEAVEHEVVLPTYSLEQLAAGITYDLRVDAGEGIEALTSDEGSLVGRVVRRRWPLSADVRLQATAVDGFLRLSVAVTNTQTCVPRSRADAIRTSLIGAHLLVEAAGTTFISLLEPPDEAVAAVASCTQRRCFPVLAGAPGRTDIVLASPIILYDYPEVAAQSSGALFDSTEIDEILTLRVMTMTEDEKVEARATDPMARDLIDRCDNLSTAELQQLHGVLRDPHLGEQGPRSDGVPTTYAEALPPEFAEALASVSADAELPWFDTGEVPWWDPAMDERVQPDVDAVVIDGVSVSKGSFVRVHPSRRADAQDLFFADQVARVTSVLSDVDGAIHVAVVLVDDPAADLHDWYGRYLYFAPDELEPLPSMTDAAPDQRKENLP